MERRAGDRRRSSALPAVARGLAGLAGLGVLAANTLILLSDRAPGLLRRLSDRVDRGTLRLAAAQVGPGRDVPEADFVLHVGMWGLATVLLGLAMGATWSRLATAGTVLAYSVGLEVAQGMYTSSRSPQRADVLANGVGVAAGLAVAVALGFLLWLRPARPTADL